MNIRNYTQFLGKVVYHEEPIKEMCKTNLLGAVYIPQSYDETIWFLRPQKYKKKKLIYFMFIPILRIWSYRDKYKVNEYFWQQFLW